MSRLLDILAKGLSIVLYPLFMPTYGIALYCIMYEVHMGQSLPLSWTVMVLLSTFLMTCVVPIFAIWLLMKRGVVTDFQIDNPRERKLPYYHTIFCFILWTFILVRAVHAPLFLSVVALGATLAIGLLTLINRWWKISAHLTGFGGLVGGVFSYCLYIGAMPSWSTIALWCVLSWILMWARLYLNAHTAAQVCAGWLMGMICTFIPYVILLHV